jgi:DNA-directed RNA polymerase specialized sigma24 family protein
MHNLFVDGARRARRSPIDAFEPGVDHAATVCPAPTPEESLDNWQRAAQLERAWNRLDRGHRVLLALRAEGYTLAEIAGVTNIAMDALSMRLYRARQSLTQCLLQERAESAVAPREAAK